MKRSSSNSEKLKLELSKEVLAQSDDFSIIHGKLFKYKNIQITFCSYSNHSI